MFLQWDALDIKHRVGCRSHVAAPFASSVSVLSASALCPGTKHAKIVIYLHPCVSRISRLPLVPKSVGIYAVLTQWIPSELYTLSLGQNTQGLQEPLFPDASSSGSWISTWVIKSNRTGKASRFENSSLGEGKKFKFDTESVQKMYEHSVVVFFFLNKLLQNKF